MSEVTIESGASSASTTDQVKERVGEGAQQLQEKATEAKGQTRERLRKQIDTRSTETGQRMSSTASALRRTADQLRQDQQEPQAKLLEQIAERTERLGVYLKETDGDRLLRDVERVVRRRPWLVAGGAAVVGFLTARFTKASSSRRHEADNVDGHPGATTGARSTQGLPRRSVVADPEGSSGGHV
jgi:ElaB/YqjD/DUF883 family membrane-anchored ribosome-binding protein